MSRLPNIIFVLADDMGYGDLGCYGARKIPTPNMDRIAAEGMRFTDAHSSSAVCTPSRYSVMTGRYCWRSPLKRSVLGGFGAPLIEPGRLTVAGLLQQRGYATYAVGKWHLGLNWRRENGSPLLADGELGDLGTEHLDGFDVDYRQRIGGGPVELGFDRWFGIAGSLDMPPYAFIADDRTVGVPDREKYPYEAQQRRGLMVADWQDDQVDVTFTRRAERFLEEHWERQPDRPFFLYLAPAAPHRPNLPPEFIRGRSQAGPRGDSVCTVDWMVGEVLELLRRHDAEEDTIIFVTSDNGARAVDFLGHDYGHRANGDWRGQKADIWEGGHREPLVVRWPGRVAAGSVCDATVGLWDFLATCAELTGDAAASGEDGDSVSFLPLLLGHGDGARREGVVHHSLDGMFSVRRGPWKLIAGLGSGGFTAPVRAEAGPGEAVWQLYHLGDDPGETDNLYLTRPEIAAELRDVLLRTVGGDVEVG